MSSRIACLRSARLAASRLCPSPRRSLAISAPGYPNHVRIVEVGPRDGLQNEKQTVTMATKLELIDKLAQTGLSTIEAGSFVSPKWVPQMASSADILQRVLDHPPHSPHPITYQWLLPNIQGMHNFLASWTSKSPGVEHRPAQPAPPFSSSFSSSPSAPPAPPAPSSPSPASSARHEISLFTAATETFAQKNINCSVAESLTRFEPIMAKAKEAHLRIRAYISVALGCPYEGPHVDPHQVADLAVRLLEMGADEISVADTTGMGTAPKTAALLNTLHAAGIDKTDLALHFHDTYGQALVNSIVALEHGIATFDAAVAGLGGCPFSPGATGNVATEDLVHCFHSLGLHTGVDMEKLAEVGAWISDQLARPNASRAGKATLAQQRKV